MTALVEALPSELPRLLSTDWTRLTVPSFIGDFPAKPHYSAKAVPGLSLAKEEGRGDMAVASVGNKSPGNSGGLRFPTQMYPSSPQPSLYFNITDHPCGRGSP